MLSIYPLYDPEHITYVYNLVGAQWARYKLSQEKETLDKFILRRTEAIFLPILRVEHSVNVIPLFFNTACALLERFQKFKQSHDIKYSIEYLRYLRGLPLDSIDIPRGVVSTSLI